MFAHMLFLTVVLSHAALIYQIATGTWHQWAITVFVYFLTGCLGVSVTYHRLLSHRAWQSYRLFEIFGTLCGTIGLIGSSVGWSAVHRQHHRYTDKEQDPHSPRQHGLFKSHFLSMYGEGNVRLITDLIRDPFHRYMHLYYWPINVLYAAGLYFIVEPRAVVYAYLAPAAVLWNCSGAVNSVCHFLGYRNFETKDDSRNNVLVALMAWGEGWHNNHHFKPMRWNFTQKWYEFDISAWIVRLLRVNRDETAT